MEVEYMMELLESSWLKGEGKALNVKYLYFKCENILNSM